MSGWDYIVIAGIYAYGALAYGSIMAGDCPPDLSQQAARSWVAWVGLTWPPRVAWLAVRLLLCVPRIGTYLGRELSGLGRGFGELYRRWRPRKVRLPKATLILFLLGCGHTAREHAREQLGSASSCVASSDDLAYCTRGPAAFVCDKEGCVRAPAPGQVMLELDADHKSHEDDDTVTNVVVPSGDQ